MLCILTVGVWEYVLILVCIFMWRPEVVLQCHPALSVPFCFRQHFSLNLEFIDLARLADQ